jgi:hypothetical protein
MKPLNFAIAEIGKQEIPKGSNWGPDVQKYLKSVGINFPASWCMAFVYWCFEEWENITGIPNPLIKTGGVLAEWNQIPAKFKMPAPFVNPPLPGDVFIMDFGKGLGHTGFVESVDADGTLHTIEGNTNDTGSREGFEVCRRTRHQSLMKGFIRIPLPD